MNAGNVVADAEEIFGPVGGLDLQLCAIVLWDDRIKTADDLLERFIIQDMGLFDEDERMERRAAEVLIQLKQLGVIRNLAKRDTRGKGLEVFKTYVSTKDQNVPIANVAVSKPHDGQVIVIGITDDRLVDLLVFEL